MNFFIKQNATLPVLKIKISKDGRSDFHSFMNELQNSNISFSLIDQETGVALVLNRSLSLLVNDFLNGDSPTEVHFYIQFNYRDTRKPGKFELKINISNTSGSISLPLSEPVYVYIQESFILHNFTYADKYNINYPCCFTPINKNNYLVTQDGKKIKTQDGYFIVVIV